MQAFQVEKSIANTFHFHQVLLISLHNGSCTILFSSHPSDQTFQRITQNIRALSFLHSFIILYFYLLVFLPQFPFLLIVWAAQLVPHFQAIVPPLAKWLCSKQTLSSETLFPGAEIMEAA